MKQRKLLLLGLVIGLMMCLAGCGKTKINLNDYLKTEVSGYDTVGKATYSIDYEGIIDGNTEIFQVTEDDLEWMKLYMDLETNISGEFNSVSNISNGDKLKFTWKVRVASIEETYDVEFVYAPVEIEVQELQEAKKVDPFEKVEYSFSGSAPYGTITFTNFISDYRVSVVADKTTGLSNGDVVTLSIKANGGETYECFFEMGVIPTEVTKKIVVSGLDSYFTKMDDLSDNFLIEFNEDALQTFETISMHDWHESEFFNGIDYVGSYLIDGAKNYSWKNLLYNIYTVDVTNAEGTFKYFFYKYYKNVMVAAEGELKYETSNDYIPAYNDGWFSTNGVYFKRGSYVYAGYEKIDTFYDDCIYDYVKSGYICLTNITEETFADSDIIFEANRNDRAKYLWKNGEFDIAKDVLFDCGDESYVEEIIQKIKYELAEESLEQNDYGAAYKLWLELGEYNSAEERATTIVSDVFEQAKTNWKNKEYYSAYELLMALPKLSESQEEEKKEIVQDYLYEQFKNVNEGDFVTFGKYKLYDNKVVQPLEWLVLEANDENIILVCRRAVEKMAFDDSGKRTFWSDCDLRKWLNEEFYEIAFDKHEKARIALSNIDVDEGLPTYKDYGSDTEDYIYILSTAELERYTALEKLIDNNTGEISDDMWTRSLYDMYSNWVTYMHENTCFYAISNTYKMGVWPVICINLSEEE